MKKFLSCFLVLFILIANITHLNAATLDELSLVNVNSNYVVVASVDGDEIESLYGKNAEAKMYPASLTKMITVYTAISNISDLNQVVTIQQSDVAGLVEANASVAGLQVGKQYTIKEILYGSMLPSGADASHVLARIVSGSNEAFVEKMNELVGSLELKNTHFVNTSGLFDENHYTTPNDLLKFMSVAFQNADFKEIISTLRYDSGQSELHPNGLTFNSTLYMYSQNDLSRLGYIKGGKTGWVPQSGYCLASFSEYKGKLVIIVTGEAYESGDQIEDHNNLYKFLFDNTHEVTLLNDQQSLGLVNLIYQDNPSKYEVKSTETITQTLPLIVSEKDLVHNNDFISEIETPVTPENKIGTYSISLDEEVLYEKEFFFDRTINRNDIMYFIAIATEFVTSENFIQLLFFLIPILLGFILLIFVVRGIKRKKRKRDDFKGYRL